MATQFGSFIALLALDVSVFITLAGPYGWPKKSFIKHVPNEVKIIIVPLSSLMYCLPIIITGIFYGLLVRSRRKMVHELSSTAQQAHATSCGGDLNQNQRVHVNVIKELQPSYDYDQILQDSGLISSYDNVQQYRASFRGYFGTEPTASVSLPNQVEAESDCKINELVLAPRQLCSGQTDSRSTNRARTEIGITEDEDESNSSKETFRPSSFFKHDQNLSGTFITLSYDLQTLVFINSLIPV